MVAQVSINPAVQSNFAGTFFSSSDGFVQGDALDDPAIRFSLRKGIVSPTATTPMWGGVAISEVLASTASGGVGATAPAGDLQSILSPASSITAGASGCLTGFTVLNQATALIQSAQSRAPYAPAGGAINFYRLGSGARIPLLALQAAATAWAGGVVDPTTIYWDTNNLWLTNASGSGIIGPLTNLSAGIWIESVGLGNSRSVNYSSGTNFANWADGSYVVVLKI
jgi:hypothetical protein